MGFDVSPRDMKAWTNQESTQPISSARGEMKVGYRSLCYRASDYPGFIWNSDLVAGFLRTWSVLDHLGAVLGRSWGGLGASWDVWEGSWAVLERSWGRLGAVLEHLGMSGRGRGPFRASW